MQATALRVKLRQIETQIVTNAPGSVERLKNYVEIRTEKYAGNDRVGATLLPVHDLEVPAFEYAAPTRLCQTMVIVKLFRTPDSLQSPQHASIVMRIEEPSINKGTRPGLESESRYRRF